MRPGFEFASEASWDFGAHKLSFRSPQSIFMDGCTVPGATTYLQNNSSVIFTPIILTCKPKPKRFTYVMKAGYTYPGYLGPLWFDRDMIRNGQPATGCSSFGSLSHFLLETPQK
jgi:hypothetical protein